MSELIAPYCENLVDLMASPSQLATIRQEELTYPSVDLGWRQICQLELLVTGAYSPLSGYLNRESLRRVLAELRLANGLYWPTPVALAVDEGKLATVGDARKIALRDAEGFLLGVLEITETWPADPIADLELAIGSGAPLSAALAKPGQHYLAGKVTGIALPPRQDFHGLRKTPSELRAEFMKRGWRKVIAYQPSQPMQRVHHEFLVSTTGRHEANLLIHVAGGADPVRNSEHFNLIRCCRAIMPRFPEATSLLAVSPALPSASGIRENLLRTIVARNYGCEMVIVGGEMQDDGAHRRGGDSLRLAGGSPAAECADALGVEVVAFPRMVYVEDRDEYVPQESAPTNSRKQVIGGEELRRRLAGGLRIPDWLTYPEVLEEMKFAYPPRQRQGFTVFFTGLSGAGKSTVARALAVKLMELGGRRVTLLDGDLVRKNLSSELGFSREHRDLNIRRIGFVAAEITKHGGIAVCAPIAPYLETRRDVRETVEPWGGFIEIHMATPLEVCERRDRKGLYAKARAGLISEFTGISDPYEIPDNPELTIDTSNCNVDEAVQTVILKLEHEGYLK